MTYDLDWYKGLASMHTHSERALWAVLAYFGRPKSLADFGCGDGWMVRTAQEAGVLDSLGIEVNESVYSVATGIDVVVEDLTAPCDLKRTFDIVLSLEVGEHLPEAAADTYIDTLVKHTKETLIFTAAKVGQGGYEHINCQDQPYWREKIETRGLNYSKTHTEALKAIWTLCTGPLIWLPQNVQVFTYL